jgi:hypothetical protein
MKEAIEVHLVGLFNRDQSLSVDSGTYYKAQAIIQRLETGDRLIAYTAGGVSWESAYKETPHRYEFPDKHAMDYLIVIRKLVSTDSDAHFQTKVMIVHELIINPEFGK